MVENSGNRKNSAEIMQKVPFQIRKSMTKFHFKVRKPYFKLRKALFKRSLERNVKNKNILEFDEEKGSGIIFEKKNICFKKII